MSEQKKTETAVYGGGDATQAISIDAFDGCVFITSTRFEAAKNPEMGDTGSCFEDVIVFELAALDSVIRELRKIKRDFGGAF